jgi:hypothetical protein
VVGGFLVTDRMLGMFKAKPTKSMPVTSASEAGKPDPKGEEK